MAPKTITQRIAFEGGQEMEVQLKALGEAGTIAFKRIQTAANDADFGTRLSAAVAAVQARFDSVATAAGNVEKKFGDLKTSAESTFRSMAILGAGVLGAVAGFLKLEDNAAQTVEQLQNAAAAAGLTTQQFQNLSDGLKIAGVDQDGLTAVINRMNASFGAQRTAALNQTKQMGDLDREYLSGKITLQAYMDAQATLTRNAETQINAFTRLGVTATQAANDPLKALSLVGAALARMPDGIEKSSLQIQIFGRNGTKLAQQFSQPLDEITKHAQAIAPAFSKLQIEVGVNLAHAFTTMKVAADNLSESVRLIFGPEVTRLLQAFTTAIVNSRSRIIELASDLAGRLEPIINDVIALLQGKEIDKDSFVARALADIVAFGQASVAVVGFLIKAWGGFVSVMNVVASAINAVFGTHVTGLELALGVAVATVTGLFGTFAAAISAVVSIIGLLAAAFGGIEVALALVGVAIGAWIGSKLVDPFNAAVNAIEKLFTDLADTISGILGKVVSWLSKVIFGANSAAQAVAKVPAAGGAPGFASGGAIRGPGTARSDSIMARLSNGEFVQQTSAVQYYGERFMHMINNMRIPRGVLSNLSGFASGGVVRAPMAGMLPAFASGGLVASEAFGSMGGASRAFVLNIDGETFKGLSAEDRTFSKLQQFATKRHISSGGRKPLWVK